MAQDVPPRSEIPAEHTWAVESIFPTNQAWESELQSVSAALPGLERFRGRLAEGPDVLVDWFGAVEAVQVPLRQVFLYASMVHNVDTGDADAAAMFERASGLVAEAARVTSFGDPEILAIDPAALRRWIAEDSRLQLYAHYLERLESRRPHVRSAEVEELLGMVRDPFMTASATHRTLADTDLTFVPATDSQGNEHQVAQGNYRALQSSPDRTLRRTAWESYTDAHLNMKHTMANSLAAGVKQDVFMARARRYPSSLAAALEPNFIPISVFENLIAVFRDNLPTWHRYWDVRRQALGYSTLHPYDVFAPLTSKPPKVSYQQAVEWIADGMRPLGDEYVGILRRGTLEDRWVDIYPNQRKTSGAYSSGAPGTRPFILMSYNDDIFSLSTLAHELGHSMHSYFTRENQPLVYMSYGLFAAETASNFNQAMVRAHLMQTVTDPSFRIALIEEAMSNFHRYFFIMPTLARLEREIHERVERGQALTADTLNGLTADLFAEAYGDAVEMDRERVGITWGEFSHHMYANFYVYQYATGISAANALAQGVLTGSPGAAGRYLAFLKAGGSMYPLDALKMAGVDMASPEPVEKAFGVLAETVEQLADLVKDREPANV